MRHSAPIMTNSATLCKYGSRPTAKPTASAAPSRRWGNEGTWYQPGAAPLSEPRVAANLFSDLLKPVKEWPGLFQIFENADGSRRVELAPELWNRQIMLAWKF